MTRINKITLSLCALLFILPYTFSSHASLHTQAIHQSHQGHFSASTAKSTKIVHKANTAIGHSHSHRAARAESSGAKIRGVRSGKAQKDILTHTASSIRRTGKCLIRHHKKQCIKDKSAKLTSIAEIHKIRVKAAQKTAINKLMGQLGKPYRWGGSSPRTGFDCSGLVYYAYKDLIKMRLPRTANEMYHLRDASPVNRTELESGDLVFFRTRSRGSADHVGVYVGNGKFIQSPRTGRDIQITSLNEDYWQRHYVGARRVVKPGTVR